MFNQKPNNPTGLEDAIANLLSVMASVDEDSDEYAKMVDQLVKLYSLKKEDTPPQRISYDTLAIVAGNLACVLVIVGYERANIMTSKAINLLLPIRR